MTCIFCQDWEQDDPNCGHAMLNEVVLPARFTTKAFVENFELGSRGASYMQTESGGHRATRIDHIDRQVHKALAGGWRVAS